MISFGHGLRLSTILLVTLLVLCSTKWLHIAVVLYTDWELFKAGHVTEPGLEISATKTQLRLLVFHLSFSFIYLWKALSTPVYKMMNTVLLESNKPVKYWCNHACDGNLNPFIIIVYIGVRVGFYTPQLILRALKLTIILVSNNLEVCEIRTDNYCKYMIW